MVRTVNSTYAVKIEQSPRKPVAHICASNGYPVNVEVLGDDTMNERMDEEFLLVEGLDDTVDERPACQH